MSALGEANQGHGGYVAGRGAGARVRCRRIDKANSATRMPAPISGADTRLSTTDCTSSPITNPIRPTLIPHQARSSAQLQTCRRSPDSTMPSPMSPLVMTPMNMAWSKANTQPGRDQAEVRIPPRDHPSDQHDEQDDVGHQERDDEAEVPFAAPRQPAHPP